MPLPTKNDRLELRLTRGQKQQIEQAAAIAGTTVTEFSVPVLVESAAAVIRTSRELQMSEKAFEEFNAILDRPARPIPELGALLRRPSVFEE